MQNQKKQLQLTSEAQIEDEGLLPSSALLVLRPNINATATISSFQPLIPHSDLLVMLNELDAQASAIWSGNLKRPEEMLSAQAHALDAIFNTLAQRASKSMLAGHVPSTEAYLRMALKAQSQCRTTLEALAEIKTPKSATFIQQANIAEQQQVNNGPTLKEAATQRHAHEKEINTSSNKLLSGAKNATLDTRGTRTAIESDSHMETMGTVHRPKNRGRQSYSGRKRD